MSLNANTNRIKLYTFWSILGVLTVAFIIIVIVMFIELKPIKSYDDISDNNLNLIGQEIFTQDETEYFVYIYNSNFNNNKIDRKKAEELKPAIFSYFNFVKRYSKKDNIIKIYGLDVNYFENRGCVGKVNNFSNVTNFANFEVKEGDIPVLLRINQGRIDIWSSTENSILSELQKAMDKIS